MATQIQATPILYGQDAERLLKQVDTKPTREQIDKAEKRRSLFSVIKKKGL